MAEKQPSPNLVMRINEEKRQFLRERAAFMNLKQNDLLERIIGWAQKDVEERTK